MFLEIKRDMRLAFGWSTCTWFLFWMQGVAVFFYDSPGLDALLTKLLINWLDNKEEYNRQCNSLGSLKIWIQLLTAEKKGC